MTASADATFRTLRELHDQGRLELPSPGAGDTAARHHALIELARRFPVGVARLAEAHCDAVAILREGGREPSVDAIYGVWASSGPGSGPALAGDVIDGTKSFCSGLGVVDRALMTVTDGRGRPVLVDVVARDCDTISIDTTGWATPALADTATGQVTYTNHVIGDDALIAAPNWYLDRPGFWHGACGPAACWTGSVIGIIDVARAATGEDPHQLAHLGAMEAVDWSLRGLLEHAGHEIDERPDDTALGERRARALRHTTERLCADVLDRFARAFGPRQFTGDADFAQRFADTHLYLRQHHGERELAALARRPKQPAP